MSAQLDIQKTVTGTGIIIYAFAGELDELNVDKVFSDIAIDIGDFTSVKVILHLGNLRYLNSRGIGGIASLAERAMDAGGKLVICSATPEVRDTLELDGIGNIIAICENERSATEQFLN